MSSLRSELVAVSPNPQPSPRSRESPTDTKKFCLEGSSWHYVCVDSHSRFQLRVHSLSHDNSKDNPVEYVTDERHW